jgi:hypothetical protein
LAKKFQFSLFFLLFWGVLDEQIKNFFLNFCQKVQKSSEFAKFPNKKTPSFQTELCQTAEQNLAKYMPFCHVLEQKDIIVAGQISFTKERRQQNYFFLVSNVPKEKPHYAHARWGKENTKLYEKLMYESITLRFFF